MKRYAIIILMIIGFLSVLDIFPATATQPFEIHISSPVIPQGSISLITIRVAQGEYPQVSWLDKNVHMVPNSKKTSWQGFLAVDLKEKPGQYKVTVKINPSGQEEQIDIKITAKDYGLQRLTLPRHLVELDDITLKRVQKEQVKMRKLWENPLPDPLWSGPFIRPVPGKVIGPFGTRRIINNLNRSPHSGVDLRGSRGTPIKASNHGRIVLIDEHFFAGKSVVIDHGGEILSMYFHLEEILVQQDDVVEKGQVIGLVGSTGRASGPHLHWGVRLNRARINPLDLMNLSQRLE